MEIKNIFKRPQTDWLAYGYAGLVLTGGVLGYIKAGSPISLASGLLFGGLLTYGAYLSSKHPSNYYLILGTSVALTLVMGQRFYKTGKFMPAGLLLGISSLIAVKYGLRLINETK